MKHLAAVVALLAAVVQLAVAETAPLDYECRSEFVPVDTAGMYRQNRQKVIELLVAENGQQPGDMIVMVGGKFETRRGSDTEILFRQYSAYYYLNDFYKYDCAFALTLDNVMTLFIPRLTESQEIFDGPYPGFDEIMAKYDVDAVYYLDEAEDVFAGLNVTRVYTLDETEVLTEFPFLESAGAPIVDSVLFDVISRSRFVKNDKELGLIRIASRVSADAHRVLQQLARPGLVEYHLENAFLQYCYACGLRLTSYIPIVGTGVNSAILHYNKNDVLLKEGDLVLVDAGAELRGYGTDITRTYPVSGVFSPDQRAVYTIVLDAQLAAIEFLQPGVTWGEVNAVAFKKILEGLLANGFVYGDVDTLYAAGVHSTFMPHNLGHLVGLDVHDSNHSTPYRAVIAAQPGQIWTVEPGVYFVNGLIDQALSGDYKQFYNADKLNQFRTFGGVRIEDVVVVAASGPNEILSSTAPKSIDEIEAAMKTGLEQCSKSDSLSGSATAGLIASAVIVGLAIVAAPAVYFRIKRKQEFRYDRL